MTGPREKEIARIEDEIATLPRGNISRKTINGKERVYLQWSENGKTRTKYVRTEDVPKVTMEVERRKALQLKLKGLLGSCSEDPVNDYECSVEVGRGLAAMTETAADYEKRDCLRQLERYIEEPSNGKVCILYGLRRTGKSVMMKQLYLEMPEDERSKMAYISISSKNNMSMLRRDLRKLRERGYNCVFIDEATAMEDFLDASSMLSSIFASTGTKIVLTGTDSLGYWIAGNNGLYDKTVMIHTTYIPFREHCRILHVTDIHDYMIMGGLLGHGELGAVGPGETDPFTDEELRRYTDRAICLNIQNSLLRYRFGSRMFLLTDLYDAGKLTNAINRIIEDMNHRFLVSVITDEFRSHDLGETMHVLESESDPWRTIEDPDMIDTDAVTERLMHMLDIRNELKVRVTPAHVKEIRSYLEDLDLITEYPADRYETGSTAMMTLFTQPGMRYCQVRSLIHSLSQDPYMVMMGDRRRRVVTDRLLEVVCGRMMEEIVILDTIKSLGPKYRVSKLLFDDGEIDMVVQDLAAHTCRLYEVEHSSKRVGAQYRHLVDPDKCSKIEERYGHIEGRSVIYRGEDADAEDGQVRYLNVERYLCSLRCKPWHWVARVHMLISARDMQQAMTAVEIRIELKKGVADPEGKNTRKTLESLGFDKVTDVKTVKLFEVDIDLPADEAVAQAEEMCRKLLANPVIQNYRVSVR